MKDTAMTKDETIYNEGISIEDKVSNAKKEKKRLLIIMIVTIIVGYIASVSGSSSKYISTVKDGYFEKHEEVSIGEGLEKFFDNPTWNQTMRAQGSYEVSFQGTMLYGGQFAETRLNFEVDEDGEYDFKNMYINNELQARYNANLIIKRIMTAE